MKFPLTKPALPAAPPALQKLAADAHQYWARLSPRERRLALVAGAVAGAALVYLILVEPAWTRARLLGEQLPQLRAQAAAVEALTIEAKLLQRQTNGKMSAEETRQSLLDSLERAGITAAIEARPAGDAAPAREGELRLRVDQAQASSLLQWLAVAPAQARLRLAQAQLTRPNDGNGRPMLGKVSGVLIFADASAAASRNGGAQ